MPRELPEQALVDRRLIVPIAESSIATRVRLSVVGDKFRIAGNRFEAPYVLKRDGFYYLMVSSGSCCVGPMTTYQVEVGRSESLPVPYVNAEGDELDVWPGTVAVTDGDEFDGSGHHTIAVDDAGQQWMLYHAYDTDQYWIRETPRRALLIDPMVWEDGRPQVPEGTPNESGTGPVVETD